MRVALYARYSSDSQRAASIADQVRLCRLKAEAMGWQVVEVYSDQALSGATMLRPGLQALLADARAGRIDMVLAEAMDRLSRDQEDVAAIYKRLRFAGVGIVTLSEGEITALHVGLKGTMNALFLQDLADKTRRGLRGRIEAGRSGGGNAYGYDVVPAVGEEDRGQRSINAAEAAIVERIFRTFAAGRSPRAIARDLNAERVPGPGGRVWMDTTLRGHVTRGTGILNNELYIGRLVWNRLRYVKDPETGRRVSRPNPPSEWVIQDVPELRIIDDALWQAVRRRQAEMTEMVGERISRGRRAGAERLNGTHRPKSLLAGLLECGVCGGPYGVLQRGRLGCTHHYRRGTCANGRTVQQRAIEARVLDGLRHRLLEPDKVEAAVRAYYEEMNRLSRESRASVERERAELTGILRKLDDIVTVLENGGATPTVIARLHELERRRAELERQLAAVPPERPIPNPNVAHLYAAKVGALADALNDQPEVALEAAEVLRGLVDRVVLTPGDKRGQVHAVLHGAIASIAALVSGGAAAGAQTTNGLTSVGTEVRPSVVAGAGFEPATFRL